MDLITYTYFIMILLLLEAEKQHKIYKKE